jgi:hypothetical protein
MHRHAPTTTVTDHCPEVLATIDDLVTDLTAERSKVVSQSHIIDDVSTALATARRALADAAWALGIAREALDNGVTDVTREYLDRADGYASGALADTANAGCVA